MRTAPDPYFPSHGDGRFHVEHYDLALTYKVTTNRLDGRARLIVIAREPLDDVRLDLSGLQVGAVKVDGAKPRRYAQRDRALTIRLERTLEPGDAAEIVVDYSGKPRGVPGPFGVAGWEELADGVLIASQPYGAPSWFPCNDFAGDKATYRVSVTTDADYVVIGNGVLDARTRRGGLATWVYVEDHPMAPYLACLHIGRYAVTPLPSGEPPIDLVAPRGFDPDGTPFARVPAMVKQLAAWFGPYPYGEYRCVITPDALEIPLEAQGLASFGRNHADDDWDNERLVVHELAHQWFGNTVTAGLGRDIWLHEGFACYTEWLWSEARGLASADERARHHWQKLDDDPVGWTLADPGVKNMFDDEVYKRGALLLHALRLTLGDEAFFGLVRSWIADHRDQVVTTGDFINHVHRATDRDLVPLFRAWLGRAPLPALPAQPAS